MLIKISASGEKLSPSHIQGKYAFFTNVILLIKNTQGKVLYVDYTTARLAQYTPPAIFHHMKYYYEVIKVQEEFAKYIGCIAKAIEDKLKPMYRNKKLECKEDVTVIVA